VYLFSILIDTSISGYELVNLTILGANHVVPKATVAAMVSEPVGFSFDSVS